MTNLEIAYQKYINEDYNNPKYIFHGHPSLLKKIIPRIPSVNKTESQEDTQFGIYGSVKLNGAIPYAIKIEEEYDEWVGYPVANYFIPPEYDYEVAVIHYGEIAEDSVGYIYVLDAATFKKSNDYQWLSTDEQIPLDIIEINYNDVKDHFQFPHLKKR